MFSMGEPITFHIVKNILVPHSKRGGRPPERAALSPPNTILISTHFPVVLSLILLDKWSVNSRLYPKNFFIFYCFFPNKSRSHTYNYIHPAVMDRLSTAEMGRWHGKLWNRSSGLLKLTEEVWLAKQSRFFRRLTCQHSNTNMISKPQSVQS